MNLSKAEYEELIRQILLLRDYFDHIRMAVSGNGYTEDPVSDAVDLALNIVLDAYIRQEYGIMLDDFIRACVWDYLSACEYSPVTGIVKDVSIDEIDKEIKLCMEEMRTEFEMEEFRETDPEGFFAVEPE